MNWILFGIHTGIIIAGILYLLLKKPKRSIFALLSVLFLAVELAIKVLRRICSEWLASPAEWEQMNNMAYVIDSLYVLNTIILVAMTMYFLIKNKKEKV
ncbi:MAG: hypothetical protein PHO15_07495 [Eubacteriales bacterium]|nr:hypothetical protein [Eubacteriales bacterium]